VAQIEVTEVRTRRDRDAFIKFQWSIYRNDPAWVPPLLIERKQFLNRKKHPFYQHGDAALFLARRNGEIVGRIMASDDPNYNSLHQANVGCFGLFECVDDHEVAAALFAAAENWVRRKGRTEIMGPIDYSTNYVCALLIDGFQYPPTILTSHNPPYYAGLIEGCGFTKAKDWYAWWFSEYTEPVERLRKIAVARAGRQGVTIRPINLKAVVEESQRIRTIYNQAWKKNWGFVPFTEAEIVHMAKEMKPLIVPGGTLIAEIGNEPVAFVIAVPDINVAFRQINGRLTWFGLPIGLIKLLYYYRFKTRTGRLIALGVIEKYRRAAIAEMLVLQVMDESFKRGITGELSMTLEDNVMVNRFIEAVGAKRYKTFRIYRRSLEAGEAVV
jgi:ribosomal protein S18 acetylase RimI-like enzyme